MPTMILKVLKKTPLMTIKYSLHKIANSIVSEQSLVDSRWSSVVSIWLKKKNVGISECDCHDLLSASLAMTGGGNPCPESEVLSMCWLNFLLFIPKAKNFKTTDQRLFYSIRTAHNA